MKTLRYLTISLTICLIFGITFCGVAQAQVSEQTVDAATREVDHSLRERAEEQLTPPLEEPPAIEEEKEPGERHYLYKSRRY